MASLALGVATVLTVAFFVVLSHGDSVRLTSGIKGSVALGPQCPVVSTPPTPGCADKPYRATLMVVRTADSSRIVASFQSDTQGHFRVTVAPGDYVIRSDDQDKLPNCSSGSNIHVVSGQYTNALVYCGTGH